MDRENLGIFLAKEIEWEPCRWGGWNVITYRLQKKDLPSGFSCTFRLANAALTSLCIFYFMPFAVSILLLVAARDLSFLFLSFLSIAFWAATIYFLKRNEFVFYVDKGIWGRVGSPELLYRRIDEICALQLLSRLCRNKRKDYYSYELNLVFADATRLNLVNHYALLAIREDSSILANILEVPLWDAIDSAAEEWGIQQNR